MTERQGMGGKAVASFILALISWGLAVVNTRPTTEGGFLATALVSFLSLALVALSIKDIWQGRARIHSLWLALLAAGLALAATFSAWACRALQEGDYRRTVSANQRR
jgi:hypothetical protein